MGICKQGIPEYCAVRSCLGCDENKQHRLCTIPREATIFSDLLFLASKGPWTLYLTYELWTLWYQSSPCSAQNGKRLSWHRVCVRVTVCVCVCVFSVCVCVSLCLCARAYLYAFLFFSVCCFNVLHSGSPVGGGPYSCQWAARDSGRLQHPFLPGLHCHPLQTTRPRPPQVEDLLHALQLAGKLAENICNNKYISKALNPSVRDLHEAESAVYVQSKASKNKQRNKQTKPATSRRIRRRGGEGARSGY